MEQIKDMLLAVTMAVLLLGLSVWCWMKSPDEYSESERRVLASRPVLTADSFWSGEYAENFEDYAMDQFPVRDGFRGLKAAAELGIFRKMDHNGLYLCDGYVSKLEYPMQEKMLDHAADRFAYLYDTYMADSDVHLYFSIVPDKNYFLASSGGYPAIDYEELIEYMRRKMEYMQYVDITASLSLDDYYRTDTHWRQENLLDTAWILAKAMGTDLQEKYETVTLEQPFYGVYSGQLALPLKPDRIQYLTSPVLEGCTVTSYDTGKPVQKTVCDMEAAMGKDPYEMFLSGSDALLVVENPAATSGRELIVFRDSFASSLVPLLIEGYSKVTLVDIRYVSGSMVGNFVSFDGQDVLFLYSTLLLNNSLALK